MKRNKSHFFLKNASFKMFGGLLFLATLLFSGCEKHEKIEFEGKVKWIRNCTASYMDQNAGYVVSLTYPEGVGMDIKDDNGVEMKNVIVLYEPTSRIYVDDRIHGTFYLDNEYSRANCTMKWDDYELPEGVFLKVKSI